MKKNIFNCLLFAFCVMLSACSSKTSVKFFGVPLGESADEALAFFEKTREKTDVAYDKKENRMEITLHNKDFYGVKFGTVKLKFVNEKLEEVYLETKWYAEQETETKFNTLIKKLEKEYGKAYNVMKSNYDTKAKELNGKGVVISVESHSYGYSNEREAYLRVVIRRE